MVDHLVVLMAVKLVVSRAAPMVDSSVVHSAGNWADYLVKWKVEWMVDLMVERKDVRKADWKVVQMELQKVVKMVAWMVVKRDL